MRYYNYACSAGMPIINFNYEPLTTCTRTASSMSERIGRGQDNLTPQQEEALENVSCILHS